MNILRKLALLASAAALLAIAPAFHTTAQAADSAKPSDKAALIDINTATAEQLQTLDGIAEARSAAIIAGRPYTNKAQIVSKANIPQAVYDKIKDKIVAKQPGGDKTKSGKKDSSGKKGGKKKSSDE